MHSHKAN